MVTALLRREFRAGFSRDPVSEHGLLALEFAGLVVGVYPVCDLARSSGLYGAVKKLSISLVCN